MDRGGRRPLGSKFSAPQVDHGRHTPTYYNFPNSFETVSCHIYLLAKQIRRYSFVSRLSADPTGIIGIVVNSTLEVYGSLSRKLRQLLRTMGRPCYLLSVGTITPVKLGNYPDVSSFVILGCPNVVFSGGGFFSPLITCFELLCGLKL